MRFRQSIFDYSDLKAQVNNSKLARLAEIMPDTYLAQINHGDFPAWKQVLDSLPEVSPVSYDLIQELRIGETEQLNTAEKEQFKSLLLGLQPWRKGPINLFGLNIDTEWRSDWKWDRLKNEIS